MSVEEEAVKESFIFDGVAVVSLLLWSLSLFLLCVYLPSLYVMLCYRGLNEFIIVPLSSMSADGRLVKYVLLLLRGYLRAVSKATDVMIFYQKMAMTVFQERRE